MYISLYIHICAFIIDFLLKTNSFSKVHLVAVLTLLMVSHDTHFISTHLSEQKKKGNLKICICNNW